MIGMTRLIAERVRFNFEDIDGPVERWMNTVFGPMDASPNVEAATEITFRFVDGVDRDGSRLWPLPMGHNRDGSLWFADHLERSAVLRFPLSDNEIVVDRNIDPWFFQRWLYFPLLRASLWQHRVSLVHGAGIVVDGHRIAISGWAGAGKSPIMLRLLGEGAELIGDDWMAMTEDGTVYPVSAQMNLNTWHRPYVDPSRWPGSRSQTLPRMKRVAQSLSRATARYPKASMGFARVADAASSAGKMKVALHDIFPSARVAAPGKLEALFFIPRDGCFAPEASKLPEVMAASSRSELLHCDDFESTVRFSYPGLLDAPLYGSVTEECTLMAQAFFPIHKEVIEHDCSFAAVTRFASHIKDVVADMRREAVA